MKVNSYVMNIILSFISSKSEIGTTSTNWIFI